MTDSQRNIEMDLETVNRIPIVASLLHVICSSTGMGFAAVARVTEDKWVACAVRDEIEFGLKPGGELTLETTICHEIRQSGEGVIIDHVGKDPHFSNHHTPAMYGFQSYISIPIIRKDGRFFGTLCAIDPKPAQLNNPKIIGMFKLFADLISFHLNAAEQLVFAETNLLEERRKAELREQFIAILGHDLRNPVTAISNSAQLLQRISEEEDVLSLAGIIKNSSYRISGLIENVLDFARGRLGGGIVLNLQNDLPLERILEGVVTELHAVWPDRIIGMQFELAEGVECDAGRIAQVVSNLLSNALIYGKKDSPVRLEAVSGDGWWKVSVINAGDKIPEKVMNRIFLPFSRGEDPSARQGLGLGLYIASEIVKAHGGTLDVVSTCEETRFTLNISSRT